MKILSKIPVHNSRLIYWQNGTIPQKNFTEERVGITITEARKLLDTKGGIAFEVFFDNCKPIGMIILNPKGS